MLEAVRRLESGQVAILNELKGIKDKQDTTDMVIKQLSDRVTAMEGKIESFRQTDVSTPDPGLRGTSEKLAKVTEVH